MKFFIKSPPLCLQIILEHRPTLIIDSATAAVVFVLDQGQKPSCACSALSVYACGRSRSINRPTDHECYYTCKHMQWWQFNETIHEILSIVSDETCTHVGLQ